MPNLLATKKRDGYNQNPTLKIVVGREEVFMKCFAEKSKDFTGDEGTKAIGKILLKDKN